MAWVLAPVTEDVFRSQHYERQHLHVRREDPHYWSDLLTLADVNDHLSSRELNHPRVKLVNAEGGFPPSEEFTANDRIILPNLLRKFREGYTIVMSSMHDQMHDLGYFCDLMGNHLCHRFQTNLYLTPQDGSQGFKCHYDTHDVFILQIYGRKLWRLYDSPFPLAHKSLPFEQNRVSPGGPAIEILLEQGDMLYIPRGQMHEAISVDDVSLHITGGLLGVTYAEMVTEYFLDRVMHDEDLRRNLPLGYIHDPDQAAMVIKVHMERLFRKEADWRMAVDRFAVNFMRQSRPRLEGQFLQVRCVDDLDLGTRIAIRPNVMVYLSVKEDRVDIEHSGNTITFPITLSGALRAILEKAELTIGEIPDELDDEAKLVLARRLVLEGILEVRDPGLLGEKGFGLLQAVVRD